MVVRMRRSRLIAGLVMVLGVCPRGAPADDILVDDFEDGVLAGEGNIAGGEWFVSKSAANLSVINDAGGLGSGLALSADLGDPPASLNVTVTTFELTELAETGDFIRVTFDFRFEGEPSVEPAFTPGFGLFNTNGTPGPGADVTDNDFGYSATISTNAVIEDNNTSFGKEPADSPSGILAGGESLNFNGVENAEVFLETGTNYELALEVAKLPTGVELLFEVDGDEAIRLFDLTGEGAFTSFDEFALRSRRSSFVLDNFVVETGNREVTIPGDFTGDSLLTDADFSRLMNNWGNQHLGLSVSYSDGDFDLDGDVDIFDLDEFLKSYDLVNGVGASAALFVPEPASLGLILVGGVLLARRARQGRVTAFDEREQLQGEKR